MTIHFGTIAVTLTAMVSAVAAQGKIGDLAIGISAEKQSVRLGDPIKVSVRVTNRAAEAAVASRSITAFDCFDVKGPDGKRLPYIGFDGQVAANQFDVRPASTATIADALDLTDKYLFQKPGQYSVRFNGKPDGLSDSPAIAIAVTPGHLSEFDEVVTSLLPVCPKGWHVVKDGHGEVTPFGRTRVPGFVLHVCLNHMRGQAVFLWCTKEEAKIDPKQQPRGKIEYLGRARELFVYASVGENTPQLWPKAIEDISRALQIKKQ